MEEEIHDSSWLLYLFFFNYLKKDNTLWLASIVRTVAVSWHAFIFPHVTYVVHLL